MVSSSHSLTIFITWWYRSYTVHTVHSHNIHIHSNIFPSPHNIRVTNKTNKHGEKALALWIIHWSGIPVRDNKTIGFVELSSLKNKNMSKYFVWCTNITGGVILVKNHELSSWSPVSYNKAISCIIYTSFISKRNIN